MEVPQIRQGTPPALKCPRPRAHAAVITAPADPDDLPEVAEKNAKALIRIEASRLGDRMKRAVRHIATGMSYREAAAVGGWRASTTTSLRSGP